MKEIQPVKVTDWSWKPFWKTLGKVLVFGLVIGVLGGVFGGLFSLLPGLLVFMLIIGVLVGVLNGFSSTSFRGDKHSKPNQGIHASGWTALRVGLTLTLAGLVVAMMLGVLIGLSRLPNGETLLSLPYGLEAALLFGLLDIGLPIGLVVGLSGG